MGILSGPMLPLTTTYICMEYVSSRANGHGYVHVAMYVCINRRHRGARLPTRIWAVRAYGVLRNTSSSICSCLSLITAREPGFTIQNPRARAIHFFSIKTCSAESGNGLIGDSSKKPAGLSSADAQAFPPKEPRTRFTIRTSQ